MLIGSRTEDALDKSIDWVQKVMGSKTDQSNESAAEQVSRVSLQLADSSSC